MKKLRWIFALLGIAMLAVGIVQAAPTGSFQVFLPLIQRAPSSFTEIQHVFPVVLRHQDNTYERRLYFYTDNPTLELNLQVQITCGDEWNVAWPTVFNTDYGYSVVLLTISDHGLRGECVFDFRFGDDANNASSYAFPYTLHETFTDWTITPETTQPSGTDRVDYQLGNGGETYNDSLAGAHFGSPVWDVDLMGIPSYIPSVYYDGQLNVASGVGQIPVRNLNDPGITDKVFLIVNGESWFTWTFIGFDYNYQPAAPTPGPTNTPLPTVTPFPTFQPTPILAP